MALSAILDSWQVVIAVLLGGAIIYLYHKLTFFKRIGIPYKTPVPFFGNMAPALLRQVHLADLAKKFYELYPEHRYTGFYDFHNPVIIIRDPEIIKSVGVKYFDNFPNHRSFVDEDMDPFFGKNLFSLRGAKWREVRNLLSPAFTSNKMRMMFELMNKCAEDFADYVVNDATKTCSDVDMKDAFTRYTNDVIATCAFGISVDSMRDPNNDFYSLGKKVTNLNGLAMIKLFFIRSFPKVSKWLNIKMFSDKITGFFKDIVEQTINTRDKQGIVRPDMLQLMMEARGKTSDLLDLNILEMTAQAFIFFFGGFDTSSTLMCFVITMTAMNTEVQENLQKEVDEIMKKTNGRPTYEHINGMAYLDAVLNETLRIYPLAAFLDRVCVEDFELPPDKPDGKPIQVKVGQTVWFPAFGIHRDPQYYPDPEVFDPNRFIDKKVTLNDSTYLPFGIGPRACIGNRFALLETKVVLFHLIAKCNLKISHKTKLPISFNKSTFNLTIEGGFWLNLKSRKLNS